MPIGVAKKGLIVTGSNCLAVGINAIKAGQEYGTGTQAPQVEAALAVKVGAQILNGKTPSPKVQYVQEQRITAGERRASSRRSAPSNGTTLRFDERRTGSGGAVARIPFSRPTIRRPQVLLEVVDLSKSYGPVRAVRGLSLDVRVGEVHAICGHNGAGKSTLVKALVGLVRPDEGVIRFDGQELSLRNPHDAQAHGIALVNQELSLVPELSVEDNIFLGGLDVPLLYRRRRLSEQARSVLDQLGLAPRAARDRGRDALDRRAAARRDRPPPRARRAPAHPRRADRDAEQAGDRARVQGDARPRRAGPQRHLRLAPARRGLRAVRPRDGAARRRCASGRTRSTRSTGAR